MSMESIQDTTHYVFSVYSLQSFHLFFGGLPFSWFLSSMYQSEGVPEFHHFRQFFRLSPGAIFISLDAFSHKCWILSLDPESEALAAGKNKSRDLNATEPLVNSDVFI